MNHSGAGASAAPVIFANGVSPYFSTATSEARITALAPSFKVAFAAVTVPSLSNAGARPESYPFSHLNILRLCQT